ncbi:MAG: hypothetical protein QOJ79_3518 [Actinomycetota bacterium]|nr:hypothetical protein [Actinomycetota bacterium]
MTSNHVLTARRNASVLAATGVTVAVLFLFPTSTNRSSHIALHPAVPAGVVGGTGAPTPAGTPAATTKTVNGAAFDTRYGPVQVQVVIRAGHIVSAKAIDYPRGSGRDREINSYAIPVLQQETVTAQNAQIDTVSGATYTSEGYARSLQSALDAAHF